MLFVLSCRSCDDSLLSVQAILPVAFCLYRMCADSGVIVQVAQAVLVPLLVDKEKVGPSSLRAIKSMMVMQPPPSFQVTPLPLLVHTCCSCSSCCSHGLITRCTNRQVYARDHLSSGCMSLWQAAHSTATINSPAAAQVDALQQQPFGKTAVLVGQMHATSSTSSNCCAGIIVLKVCGVQIDGGQVGVAGPPAGAVQQSKTSDALYLPSATASWRMNMLTDGNLSDAFFRQIKCANPIAPMHLHEPSYVNATRQMMAHEQVH